MIRMGELIVISWDDVMMSGGSEEGWVLCATVGMFCQALLARIEISTEF